MQPFRRSDADHLRPLTREMECAAFQYTHTTLLLLRATHVYDGQNQHCAEECAERTPGRRPAEPDRRNLHVPRGLPTSAGRFYRLAPLSLPV
jgi:hypothetical protein